MSEISLGILVAGSLPPEISEKYGQYPELYSALLSGVSPRFRFASYAVHEGEMPPQVDECDAWLISGSRASAYENQPWIAELEAFLVRAHGAQIPLVGICFGHQILAQALGGRVEKAARGWGVGIHHYDIIKPQPWLTGDGPRFAIQAYHQDQVTALPAGCEVLAGSAFCPHAVLSYGDHAISVQGHPEFSTDFARQLIQLRRGHGLPEAVADKALAELPGTGASPGTAASLDSDRVAHWIANFVSAKLTARD